MNRRSFLSYLAAGVSGAALTSIGYQWGATQENHGVLDLERALLGFFDPDYAQLKVLFPDISQYEQVLSLLTQRGLVNNGQLDMLVFEGLAKTDPIMDFDGLQYLESELLVYLAAYLLVEETQCKNGCTGSAALKIREKMMIIEGIDFYGQDIATLKVVANDDVQAANACSDACQDDGDCSFFTLATKTHPVPQKRHMCWLKKEGVLVKKGKNYYSGIKQN